jgi:DHA3 family macrolide efflux protein-like MFS transporter
LEEGGAKAGDPRNYRYAFLKTLLNSISLLGLLLPIINGSFGATLQATIAAEMQGRVFAFIFSAAMLVSPIVLMIAGPVADAFGIQLWFLIADISCALMGIFGFFSSEVIGMENKSSKDAKRALTGPS